MWQFNPKRCGGRGRFCPEGTDMGCIPSIFIKTSQISFWWKLIDVGHFLRLLRICWGYYKEAIGGAEGGHPFFSRRILAKNFYSQKLMNKKKKTICQIFHQKKIQKVLMKIEEMADVFLNSANFAPHAFLTLAPPSSNCLNLKSLIKVSKVSWRS